MNQLSRSLRTLQFFSLGGLISTSIVFLAPQSGYSVQKDSVSPTNPKEIVDEVWQVVNRNYVDSTFHHTDWQATRRQLLSKNYTSKKQAYNAIRAALKTLGDPYTRFLDPNEFAQLNAETSGELSGIGVKLGMDKKTKALTVIEPVENSPAFKAGLRTGDRILGIDGKLTQGMDAEKATSLIRGTAGTTVKLKIARQGQKNFDVAINRAVIHISNVKSALKQEGNNRIGYIRLSGFDAHASDEVRQAIQTLSAQKAQGFILDLRGNPGGLLDAAINISRLWLHTGDIVRTVDRDSQDERIAADQTAVTQLPLTVLVDGNSASSSEILAGALKDNQRATVVGTKTFGKAAVQGVHPLPDGSGVNVTVAHYYTPKGTDINKKGIVPDVAIALTKAEAKKLAENPKLVASPSDPQYLQAVRTVSKQIQAYKPFSNVTFMSMDRSVAGTQPSWK
jgi:carboxyl-terminal processing protease